MATHSSILGAILVIHQMVKNLPTMGENWVLSVSPEDPWRREQLPTPVFSPGEFHGKRSLVGYSQSMILQRVRHN